MLTDELEDCIAEYIWGSLVFLRQWGVQPRDLMLRPPEWCAGPTIPSLYTVCEYESTILHNIWPGFLTVTV